jgi:ABC-type transport system involved in multi-copper enzyme maturation permease subunit
VSAAAPHTEARETESRLLRLPFVDEALAVREWRRARRWLLGSGVPLLYVLGTILLPWLVVPALASAMSWDFGQPAFRNQPRWMFLTLALTLVGGGMATAFARVSQLWYTERLRHTLEGWLLARQDPGPVVATASLSGAALALIVSVPGMVLLAVTAAVLEIRPGQTLLTLSLLLLGAALAAAAASAAFFATTATGQPSPTEENAKTRKRENAKGTGMERDPAGSHASAPVGFRVFALSRFRVLFGTYRIAVGALLLLVLALWLRIEAVEHGWSRAWEEHPSRMLLAAGLLTPAPALIGFADRRWWVFQVVERLDFPILPEAAAMLLLLLYAVGTLVLLRWSAHAYRLLRANPERDSRAAPSALADSEANEAGAGGYWAGFANPVWTRELRTRLRGREAPQFIFFASVALAVGGFTPLVTAASQLGDPMETATVARDVFFWLAMTLTAMVALIAPGLTAEAIGAERTRGTLELLLATPLRRPEILRGKLLGDLCVLALLVSPSLPLFGFCYLFHGASGPQVIAVFIVLGLTGLMCALLGITASAIQPRTMGAKWQAYLLSLLACCVFGGPFWLAGGLASSGADTTPFAVATPLLMMLYGFVLASLWSRACERLDYAENEG